MTKTEGKRTRAAKARSRASRRPPIGERQLSIPAVVRRCLADPRMPPVGTELRRTLRTRGGKELDCVCIVRADGFESDGELFRSLTDVATQFVRRRADGSAKTRRNGFEFFRLTCRAKRAR